MTSEYELSENLKEILSKLKRYSAYRERCKSEIEEKMSKWSLSKQDRQNLLAILEEEDFIDEERYARIYARSKFMQNHWGRKKIRMMLKAKRIDDTLIDQAMSEIEEDTYLQTLNELVMKKYEKIRSEGDPFKIRGKLSRYLVQRGYEQRLFIPILDRLLRD